MCILLLQERASLDRQRQNLKAKLRQASETEADVKFLQGENKELTRSLSQATAEVGGATLLAK
jgi:cell shape-determining protein MreC